MRHDADSDRVYYDAFNLLCGDLLGEGVYRKVFEYKLDPTYVIKVETDVHARSFMNAKEYGVWTDYQHAPKVAEWLAPCRELSPDGRILIQARTNRPPHDFTWPEKLPSFLTDRKHANYGLYQGRLVCHDYASFIQIASPRLTPAAWW